MDLRKYMAALVARPAPQERTNVLRFLAWAQSIDEDQRAQVAAMLARAYLAGRLCLRLSGGAKAAVFDRLEALMRDADACLAALVLDASSLVRRALAEALAGAPLAPRHFVIALANDEPCIGAIVLRQSPLLTEVELKKFAIEGDENIQIALAQRPCAPNCVVKPLVENGGRKVVLALLANSETRLSREVLCQIAGRFVDDREIRDALLGRDDLPAFLRYDIIDGMFRGSLLSFRSANLRRLMKQMTSVVRDRDLLRTSANLDFPEICDLAHRLRVKGALTVSLLMRSLVSGNRAFFEAAMVELSGIDPAHAIAFTRNYRGAGFCALYRRTGLPAQFLAPIRAALAALDELGSSDVGLVSRDIVSRVIANCERCSPELGELLAFLRRLESEAALDEGHDFVNRAMTYDLTQNDGSESGGFAIEDAGSVNEQERQPILLGHRSAASIPSPNLAYQQVA